MTDPSATPQTSWAWPEPPRSNRFQALVTEIHDTNADDRRVAVIEGAVWPPVGTQLVVHDDADHVRQGTVEEVALLLLDGRPATVRVRARLDRVAR
jgi:hypothetical protein